MPTTLSRRRALGALAGTAAALLAVPGCAATPPGVDPLTQAGLFDGPVVLAVLVVLDAVHRRAERRRRRPLLDALVRHELRLEALEHRPDATEQRTAVTARETGRQRPAAVRDACERRGGD